MAFRYTTGGERLQNQMSWVCGMNAFTNPWARADFEDDILSLKADDIRLTESKINENCLYLITITTLVQDKLKVLKPSEDGFGYGGCLEVS